MAVYFLSEGYLARPEAAMVVAVIDDAELSRGNTMDRFLRTDAVSSVSGMLYRRPVDVRCVPYLECYVMLRHDIVCEEMQVMDDKLGCICVVRVVSV